MKKRTWFFLLLFVSALGLTYGGVTVYSWASNEEEIKPVGFKRIKAEVDRILPSTKYHISNAHGLMEARQEMVLDLMAIVERPAKTDAEMRAKAAAIKSLGTLQAKEAAPLLVREIGFEDPFALMLSEEMSLSYSIVGRRPCVAALISIGKPSTVPILAGIKSSPLAKPYIKGESINLYQYHERLLIYLHAIVLRDVEGVEPASQLIQQQLKTASEDERNSMQFALRVVTGNLNY